jgi:hypothetical protein
MLFAIKAKIETVIIVEKLGILSVVKKLLSTSIKQKNGQSNLKISGKSGYFPV